MVFVVCGGSLMFKSKRSLELEKAEDELYLLKNEIRQMMYWCAEDSPEIGFAMRRLLGEDEYRDEMRLAIGEINFVKGYSLGKNI